MAELPPFDNAAPSNREPRIVDAAWHPLVGGGAPEWADAWGEDEFGIWAAFTLADVTQRLRWVPPGEFLMGSPETEPGRDENEGPAHKVVITEGYWLFDTPCTQTLWEAVMGENPSRFKSPDRPVEQVSWDDVQGFLERLPGLDLVLPSEAQWEHACRAGTETALYTGPIEILGESNAPALEPIAWYGGNSGVDFDLPDGVDSSGWPEKQFAHELAGTRKVKGKQPNAWGLYDMLGNVLEWCADGPRTYREESEINPMGPMDEGSDRVLRGGSWYYYARFVRCASRIASPPDNRDYSIGFRCARVQA